jgi:hypothetical protein
MIGKNGAQRIWREDVEERLRGFSTGQPRPFLRWVGSKRNLLRHFLAAKRVNTPGIKRAHAAGHPTRRKAIVKNVQRIVDDCLAVLLALG